jgi:hypothetical protein
MTFILVIPTANFTSYIRERRKHSNLLSFAHQHPSSAMDVHMYPLTLSTTRFKHSIWDLPSSFPGGKRTIYTFRQDDGLGKGSFAFPTHLAVRRGSDLSTIVRKTWRTSYHLGPSAQILINFSLNSSVCLSIVLRSNFAAGILTSDSSDMVESLCCLLPCSFFPSCFKPLQKILSQKIRLQQKVREQRSV